MSTHTLTPHNAAVLTHKLFDADPDIRFMSLNDLLSLFNSNTSVFLSSDFDLCSKILDGFLHTLVDSNGEVQNLTIKCFGAFVLKAEPRILKPLLHKIVELQTDDTVDSSISAMAIRAVVGTLPRPAPSTARSRRTMEAYDAISKVLIPRLVGHTVHSAPDKAYPPPSKGMLQRDLESGVDRNALDVLMEVTRCFGSVLHAQEIKALQQSTQIFIESDRASSVMKKKAVNAMAALSQYFSESLLSDYTTHLIQKLTDSHLRAANRKTYINVLGSLARAIPGKFGPHLKTLLPFVFAPLSQEELDEQMGAMGRDREHDPVADEVREAALTALDNFEWFCSGETAKYIQESMTCAFRFLRYDPNYVDVEENDSDEMDQEFDSDEDFEAEIGADDEDDLSWKVRRCAARFLRTIIIVKGQELLEQHALFVAMARALISGFSEREENVRLEVINTMVSFVQNTAQPEIVGFEADISKIEDVPSPTHAMSRKRRRTDSDASISDAMKARRLTGSTSPETQTPSRTGSSAYLGSFAGDITKAVFSSMKTTSISVRQGLLTLLKELIVSRSGGLNGELKEVIDFIVESLKPDGSVGPSLSSVQSSNIQIKALQLTSELAKTQSSADLQPYMQKIIPAVLSAVHNRVPQVSCEALRTCEQLMKVLTPPRSAHTGNSSTAQIEQLRKPIYDLVASKSVDLVARQQGLSVMGTLIGRTLDTAGSKLMSQKDKQDSMDQLYDAMRNETTRFAAIKAVNNLGALASSEASFGKAWFGKTCLELGAQLRKADRALRGISLSALRTLISAKHGSGNLDTQSSKELANMLIPLLASEDLHMISPSLIILAAMIQDSDADISTRPEFVEATCKLVASENAAPLFDNLGELMDAVGRYGSPQQLMSGLLRDVGVSGSSAVVGKAIGTLLVSSKTEPGVRLKDFLTELDSTTDDRRKCLALSVLGEVGLRSGSSSDLSSNLFTAYFEGSTPDVSLTAAIALGRAAAGEGNPERYIPALLSRMSEKAMEHYLLLHAIKELLQHTINTAELFPYAQQLWLAAVQASTVEDNRTVGAECVANLAMIEPRTFLLSLQALLGDASETTRGVAILALRDVFTSTDSSYNKYLRAIIIDALTSALSDKNLDNRRLALNTFNAAARNKPLLVLPHLHAFLPLVFAQTFEDPSLIREVNMGPFKHKVDDGLEVRKSAYETLYTLLDIPVTYSSSAPMDQSKLLDRAIHGVSDDQNIRNLSQLMLLKLAALKPELAASRLDDLIDRFRKILGTQLKDTAVRHEHERAEEAKRGVVRTSLELARTLPEASSGLTPSAGGTSGASSAGGVQLLKWTGYLDDVRRDYTQLVKECEKEMRERQGLAVDAQVNVAT